MIKLLLCFVLFLSSFTAVAETKVTAIIPYAAGGGVDSSFKHFQQYLKDKKNINLIPVYRPGAESLIGSQVISQSAKDGSVIGYTNIAGLASVVKNNNLAFEYVSATRKYPTAIVASSTSNVNSFDELLLKLTSGHVFHLG